MNFKHILAGVGIIAGLSTTSLAQTGSTKTTTTAVPFLRIAPDARSGGMGDAGIAASPDVNAVFWNRAKLPFAQAHSGIAANYTPWFKEVNGEMYMASLAAYHQLDDNQALSASMRYFNIGEIEQTDYAGTVIQTNRPREFAVDLGYSRALSKNDGISVAMRYIHSKLINGSVNGSQLKNGSSVAADLSYYHNGQDAKGQGWTWGVALSNLGSKISYSDNDNRKDFIPAKLGVGLGYTAVFDEDNQLLITGDLNKLLVPSVPLDSSKIAIYQTTGVVDSWIQSFEDYNRLQFSAGLEYSYKKQFLLRTGYCTETKNEGGRNYFTAGAGINYHSLSVNFSYLVPFNESVGQSPMSNTLRFGLVYTLHQ